MLWATYFAIGVLGNAEKIILYPKQFQEGHLRPNQTLQLALPYEVSSPISLDLPASYGNKLSTQFVEIQGIAESAFEVRVCWPASHPVDFTLRLCEDCQSPTVLVDGIYSGESISKDIERIQFFIVAEELMMGVIPRSTISAITMALLWSFIGGLFTKYFIQQMDDTNRTINQQKSK
jgi:hypothetical protein